MSELLEGFSKKEVPERTQSLDCISKQKRNQDFMYVRKRSIDSKTKIKPIQEKLEINYFKQFDEIATVKKARVYKNQIPFLQPFNEYFVSQIDQDQDDYQSTNTFGTNDICSYFQSFDLEENLIDQDQDKEKEKEEPSRALKSIFAFRHLQKQLLVPFLQCPLCQKTLESEKSTKLPCYHRFHSQCAEKMFMRNNHRCEICMFKRKERQHMLKKGKSRLI